MLTYSLDKNNKYFSLYRRIRDDILSGKIKGGSKLPSKRELAENLSVSVVTVQNAYGQLYAEGYICPKERSGYFVAENVSGFYGGKEEYVPPTVNAENYKIDLVKGATQLFPFSVWAKLMRSVLSDCGEHLLERIPCDGDAELKAAVAAYLYRARGIDADPRFIVIGAGAEYLYGVIVQLLGRDKLYAVENPGYGKISVAYGLNGAKRAFVGVGEDGVKLDEVDRSGAYAVHVSPSHQYPTGAVIPAANRLKLIQRAVATGGYIIEDDYDSEFRLSGKPLQSMVSLCPERVIYLNTFSKSLAPSMRMGYMVLPPALYEKYLSLFSHSACVTPLFEQKTLAKMLDGGYFERHISRLKNYYKSVRQAVVSKAAEIKGCKITDTGSGLHFLAEFSNAPSDGYIKETAAANGINVKCLSDYLLSPAPVKEKCAVINYTGVTPEQIKNLDIGI